MADKFVTIATFANVLEANLAKARLQQEGIDVLLEEENVAALNYWAASPFGAKLKVKEAHAGQAAQMLEEIVRSDDPLDDVPADD